MCVCIYLTFLDPIFLEYVLSRNTSSPFHISNVILFFIFLGGVKEVWMIFYLDYLLNDNLRQKRPNLPSTVAIKTVLWYLYLCVIRQTAESCDYSLKLLSVTSYLLFALTQRTALKFTDTYAKHC